AGVVDQVHDDPFQTAGPETLHDLHDAEAIVHTNEANAAGASTATCHGVGDAHGDPDDDDADEPPQQGLPQVLSPRAEDLGIQVLFVTGDNDLRRRERQQDV